MSKAKELDVNEIQKLSADDILEYARTAEAAERYPDMCTYMKALVLKKTNDDKVLEIDERNLLSVAYKNVVGSKRQSWRTLSSHNEHQLDKAILDRYRAVIEFELDKVCNDVLDLLKAGPVKTAETLKDQKKPDEKMSGEDGVFYLKMCGDYYRYLAEFKPTEDSHQANAEKYYEKAFALAKKELPETHPTRLGLALNFSVCYYEILKKKEKACGLAKEAFDSAIEKLDTLNDASYKDSTLIMQLLRDNLTLWTSENQDAGDN